MRVLYGVLFATLLAGCAASTGNSEFTYRTDVSEYVLYHNVGPGGPIAALRDPYQYRFVSSYDIELAVLEVLQSLQFAVNPDTEKPVLANCRDAEAWSSFWTDYIPLGADLLRRFNQTRKELGLQQSDAIDYRIQVVGCYGRSSRLNELSKERLVEKCAALLANIRSTGVVFLDSTVDVRMAVYLKKCARRGECIEETNQTYYPKPILDTISEDMNQRLQKLKANEILDPHSCGRIS